MGWLRRLFSRDRLERELEAELTFHVDEETRRLVASGVDRAEAKRRALATFGRIEPIKELARDARRTRWVEDLAHDVRYAGRMMRRNPGFTLAAVLSLAIGIGANSTIFSVADALLVRPLTIDRPEEVYFPDRTGFDEQNLRFSHPGYERLRDGVADVSFAAMSSLARMQATMDGPAEQMLGQLVTGNWFDVVGVKAEAGRLLTPDDTRTLDGPAVVVLSDLYWRRRFAADQHVVGTHIRVNGVPATIVGVAAPGFSGLTVGERNDVWLPVTLQHTLQYRGNASVNDADQDKPWVPQDGIEWLTVVARVRPPVTAAAATARIDALHRQALERSMAAITDPERRAYRMREHISLLSGARGLSDLRADFSAPLGVLMGTVALVLLIACANLASLLLARSSARSREFALRLSIGARRSRLVRQLLTESVVLALIGGVAAVLVARWGGQALLSMASGGGTPIPLDLPTDWALIAFTLVLSGLTGVAFGLAPALRFSRTDLADSLRSTGRVAGVSERPGALPFGKALVASQMALSLALLVGAALFVRTFQNLLAVDTGFERDQVVSARFDPRLAGFAPAQLPALYERLLRQARQIPGVRTASLALSGPVTGSARVSSLIAQGRPRGIGGGDNVREEYVGPDYFATMGMALAKGRDFVDRDDTRAPKVAIVNEAFAKHFFGEASPLGRKVGYDEAEGYDIEIVGVARDARVDGLRRPVPIMAFYPLRQHTDEFARNLYVRATGPVDLIKTELRRAVAAADGNLAIREVATLADLTGRTVSRERLVSQLTSAFALIALGVACLGLYGTVSYSVVRRTNEIGVRLALGASPQSVRWMILRETLVLAVIGCLLGLALLLPTLNYVASLLYGLSPRDPATLAGATILLLVMSALAGAVPAWRASRVDPLTALRAE
jgi:predicted permease